VLTFESEFTTLIKDLWTLNKSMSNPFMRRDIGKVLTQNVPKYKTPLSAEAEASVKDLQQNGFHILALQGMASDFSVEDVRSRLENCRITSAHELNYQTNLVAKREFTLKNKPDDVFLAGYDFEDVIRCTPLVKLACNPNLVAAIESYIGCTPTISGFQIWHTFPGHSDLPAESFHRDRDCFNFIKLFVYMSEVDSTAGPHQFIQYSHNPNALQALLKSKGINVDLGSFFEGNSRNLKLSDLEKLFAGQIKTFTGPAGLAFIEDTYGLHRGTRPTTSSRLIFSVTYTGLPLRYANENDRTYEMSRKTSFSEAGLENPTELERYLFRFFLH
jgi:hypothetical protein